MAAVVVRLARFGTVVAEYLIADRQGTLVQAQGLD